jgi:hypothetical protein
MTYAEILSWAPNVEGGRATYLHTNKKKWHTQSVQLDLNLSPTSWRVPHQIQSCLARYYFIITSLGPDWHDKTMPMLWRTRFAASSQPILRRMGPQPLRVQPTLVLTLQFARCSCP